MIKVNTLIKDLEIMNKASFLSIDDPLSINLANKTLVENDHDYLEGAIRLEYNSEIILTEDMETTDLLLTWQDLIQPILTPCDKKYEITILDSLYEVDLLPDDAGFTFCIHNIIDNNRYITSNISKEEYEKGIKEGFLAFGAFIKTNDFPFSEESS